MKREDIKTNYIIKQPGRSVVGDWLRLYAKVRFENRILLVSEDPGL